MTAYQVRLEGREEIAEGTMAFHFEKPTAFRFKPGQAIDVVLLDTPTADGELAVACILEIRRHFRGTSFHRECAGSRF